MAFFGLTTLGPSNPVHEGTALSQDYHFHGIEDVRYQECFDKYLLGSSSVATTLEVDGDTNILRASLGDMLRELLGRQPRKYELEAWFSYLDFDRSPVMSLDEFTRSVQRLKDFSANPAQPKQYQSYNVYHTDWTRSVRVNYDQQATLKAPFTTQQEIGWHVKKPAPPRVSKALNHTDVTIKEGRTAASYYGHFVCGQ